MSESTSLPQPATLTCGFSMCLWLDDHGRQMWVYQKTDDRPTTAAKNQLPEEWVECHYTMDWQRQTDRLTDGQTETKVVTLTHSEREKPPLVPLGLLIIYSDTLLQIVYLYHFVSLSKSFRAGIILPLSLCSNPFVKGITATITTQAIYPNQMKWPKCCYHVNNQHHHQSTLTHQPSPKHKIHDNSHSIYPLETQSQWSFIKLTTLISPWYNYECVNLSPLFPWFKSWYTWRNRL